MALRVLLADNSESIKKVIQITLKDMGVELKVVGSGLDVIDVATLFNPDIIFVDVHLQKMSGYEIAKTIKSHPQLKVKPVVLMWSGFLELDEDKVRESLADETLEKPFEAEKLKEIVSRLTVKKSEAPSSMPFNIRDHLEAPDEPELMATDSLPEIAPPQTLSDFHSEDFEQVNISSVPNFAKEDSSETSNFNLQYTDPEKLNDVSVVFKEPEAVENMDFLLNNKANPNFKVDPVKTISLEGTDVVIKTPGGSASLTQSQLEEMVREQCYVLIEKMAWKLVPEMASKIVKEELSRLIRDTENKP